MIDGDDKDNGLVQPDLILPIQFFDALHRRRPSQGEQRLVLAILEDALNCFQKNIFASRSRKRRLFREAEAWLMSENEEPFSFEHVCAILGLEPTYVRDGVHRWYEQQHARGPVTGSCRRASTTTHSAANRPCSGAMRLSSARDRRVQQLASNES